MRFFFLSAVLLSAISGTTAAALGQLLDSRALSPDSTCGTTGAGGSKNGYSCPQSLPCCSQNGFCGAGNGYCLTTAGCQAAYGNCTAPTVGTISPDMTCGMLGAGKNGYSCPAASPCCSGNGWCGSTNDYCSATTGGCQSKFGKCNAAVTSSAPAPGSTIAPGTGKNGRCGAGFGTCASNECCSLSGYCGKTADYCNAPDCQFTYGPACDANKTPTGKNTSTIARPKNGAVLYGSDGIYDCVKPGTMALTFDDGPYIYTSHILDLLDQYNAKATFFITGNNNGKGAIDNSSLPWSALIKRMYASGHQLASHTWSHADLCTITSAQRKNEMYKLEMAMRNLVGVIPTYMRPPYSSCTAACGCEADMASLGYHITYFDLDTADYLNDSPALIQNSKNIFDQALAGASAKTDDFLLIGHDIHNQTSNALVEYMLKGMKTKGYKGVTVGDCLGDPKASWYRTDTSAVLGA
ncbi:chitin deacetylase [Phlyctema vagabunda]|uniref:Chitin deacetylase n=1 Tax=Phlyctema vagabunda TaxID=108571 RepID=A0ABR4PWQ9_9HELO